MMDALALQSCYGIFEPGNPCLGLLYFRLVKSRQYLRPLTSIRDFRNFVAIKSIPTRKSVSRYSINVLQVLPAVTCACVDELTTKSAIIVGRSLDDFAYINDIPRLYCSFSPRLSYMNEFFSYLHLRNL